MLLSTVACVLLAGGVLAGVANHHLLSGDRFARHVDAIRQDDAVARVVGDALAARILADNPNLVAVRPLVQSASRTLGASPAFGPIVRLSAREVHRGFTTDGGVLVRLADLGVVVAGVLPTLAPDTPVRIPPDLQLTLAQARAGSTAADAAHAVGLVGLLSWLLPVLALCAAAAASWLAADERSGLAQTGWAVAGSGAIVGLLSLITGIVVSFADETTLRGALTGGAWREFRSVLWWAAGLALVAGLLLVTAAAGRLPTMSAVVGRLRTLARRPVTSAGHVLAGVAAVVVGLGVIFRASLVFGVLAALLGIGLLVVGLGELAAVLGPRPARKRASRRRVISVVAAVVAVMLVVGLTAVDAAPVDRAVPTSPSNGACNGHVELCGRRYDQVAYPATHNAMSAADEPGWFIPEQPTGVIGQLDDGVRVLLIDTYYGQRTERRDVVATAPQSYATALAEATRLYGSDVVDSALRLRNAITSAPSGPVRPYLCHGLCEIGSTDWEPLMVQVKTWLDMHPREVVTFFIEDSVSSADTAAVFAQAGLLPYVHEQATDQPWPTLGQMITSGRRVVVLMERHAGGTQYPWLLPGFDVVQDTPFTNPTVADLSCRLNRGQPGNPLLLLNYWLSNFRSLVTDARTINAEDVLWPYVTRCREQRARLPNFIAVNFVDEGDLFRVVDRLNGVGG